MSASFSAKLSQVLKALSMSNARLASDLGVHKSVVGRWMSGAVTPSPHNLSRLSALIAERIPGFTTLDWDKDLETLNARLTRELTGRAAVGARGGLPLALLGQILTRTAIYAPVYEGFYRSTRPYARYPGRYLHDYCMVKKDETGFLRLTMSTAGVFVDGWVLLLHDQLFIIGAELTSASLVFAILHGVDGGKAEVLDGLTLSPNLDPGRTLASSGIVLHRIGDLSGAAAADEARFVALAAGESEPRPESIPLDLRNHLARYSVAAPIDGLGDWQMRLPRSEALSRVSPAG
jgi:transcriptional regulator with XRE-family HTH domain